MSWLDAPSVVVCPDCRGPLAADVQQLKCVCGARWTVRNGTPRLFRAQRLGRRDRLMRRVYDLLSPVHDPITEHLLPHLQGDEPDEVLRRRMVARLDLGSLTAGPDGFAHVLEVGIGGGAMLPFILEAQGDVPLVYWGLDLSSGMLRQCRGRLPVPGLDVRLVQGDACALPFADQTMARVLHVGALGTFAQPAVALAEMARVTRPNGRVVVVDEELDAQRSHLLRHRLAFRVITFNQAEPASPVDLVPGHMENVQNEALSRFFYLLSFDKPGAEQGV